MLGGAVGPYGAGFVNGAMSPSDKRYGVVALVLMDLRRRGAVGALGLCGRQGTKMPAVRAHLAQNVAGAFKGLDPTMRTFPADDVAVDDLACTRRYPRGSCWRFMR